ncbi:MAG: iron transporter [Haloferacaceae archaeon]
MRRRALLSTLAAGLGATAGCLGGVVQTTNSRSPPVLDGRPDAVYVPSHQEGMKTVGRGTAGDLTVAVTYSYPHRFWTVEREDGAWTTQKTGVDRDDAVHLMAVAFHEPTGTVVPNAGVSAEVTENGSLVAQEVVYPMLSQRMGVHYGANVPLPGNGDYEVTVSVGGTSDERYGALAGLFGTPATATVSFPYREAERNEIGFERFRTRAGTRGAVEPMSMEMLPDPALPDPLPGEQTGTASVGDVRFVGTRLDADRFGGPYLAVSAQSPYNRLPVPGVGLSATVGSESVDLRPSLDPDLGFHYGAPVAADDTVALAVEVPAQVARHEGYETAFLATGTATLSE